MDKMVIIISIASEIFEIDKENISTECLRHEIPQWDSLNHLRLVSEVEDKFGINIPFEKVADIKRIKDFEEFLN